MKTFRIDSEDLGIEFRDSGAWRSYSLSTEGSCLDDMLTNATIEEIDQDGGELRSYGIDEANGEVEKAATKACEASIERAQTCACTMDAFCRSHR